MTPKQSSFSARFVAYLSRRSIHSLLLFVLAATLIPVFVISFGQAYARLGLDREVVRQNLIDAVALSAEQALHVIDSSKLSLTSLAVRSEVRDATPTCSQTLAIAQLAMPYTTNLARVDASGVITCTARPILMNPNISDRSWLSSLSKLEQISFAGPTREVNIGRPALILGLGMKNLDGTSSGHLIVGIDLEKLQRELQNRRGDRQAKLSLVDQRGADIYGVFARSALVPHQPTEIDSDKLSSTDVKQTNDAQGKPWTYVSAKLVPGKLFLVLSMPDELLYSSTFGHMATDIALPLIALIFASAGLWYAIQLWAIRPIELLRALAKQYAVGRFDANPPSFQYGPIEMKELRDELASMAERARNRDERMKRVARQKDELLKELHHRVKNNLQIVISLIGLQTRQIHDPAQKVPLERVHARIMAMALVERLIVETDDNPSLDVCQLLEEICGLVRRLYRTESLRIKLNFKCDHLELGTEKATALALFAFEAITNAFRHGFPENSEGSISMNFEVDPHGVASLNVQDTGTGWNDQNKETGTGHRLLIAFARQLGGQFSMTSSANAGSHVNLRFTLPSQPPFPPIEESLA